MNRWARVTDQHRCSVQKFSLDQDTAWQHLIEARQFNQWSLADGRENRGRNRDVRERHDQRLIGLRAGERFQPAYSMAVYPWLGFISRLPNHERQRVVRTDGANP